MALYGSQRDVSLIRHINRELIADIISQECAYYKLRKVRKIDREKLKNGNTLS